MVHCFLTFHRSLDATEGTKTEASIDPPFDSRVSGPRDRLNQTSLSGHLRRFLAYYHSAAVIALWRKTHGKHCHGRTGGSIITTASMCKPTIPVRIFFRMPLPILQALHSPVRIGVRHS
jgi:hypothetical protein